MFDPNQPQNIADVQTAASAFDLGFVQSATADFKPQKMLVYGVQGLGKTTFGCTWPDPILLRIEDGAAAIDVPTFPKLVEHYAEAVEAINALHGEHNYKTLVVDSLDWLEPAVWTQTCGRLTDNNPDRPISSVEDIGYGKGYVAADEDWRYLMGGLDSLRLNRGMHVVLVAHAEVKRFEPPDSDPYDRYQIKLHKRAWALWQEWADMVLFANYSRRLIKTKSGGKDRTADKYRAEGSGERVLYTEERPAHVAKNRWGLPPEIHIGKDKSWSPFHVALAEATQGRYQVPNHKENAA